MSEWFDRALNVLEDIAREQEEFTSDNLHTAMADDPDHFNQVGKVFQMANRMGLIEQTGGFVRSLRKEAKGRNVQVWRSLIFKKGRDQGRFALD